MLLVTTDPTCLLSSSRSGLANTVLGGPLGLRTRSSLGKSRWTNNAKTDMQAHSPRALPPPLRFLGQHRVDDLPGFGLGETAMAQEVGAVFVGSCHDPLARRLDAVDEGQG